MPKSIVAVGTALAAVLAVSAAPPATAAPAPGPRPAAAISWKPCPDKDPVAKGRLKGLECGTLRVPLDHWGQADGTVTLALTRARHTSSDHQGAVLLNRGGPGATGRDLPAYFRAGLPEKVAAKYDWIGFDPRGVGASEPSLVCDPSYQDPGRPRPDTVPGSAAEEAAWVVRARRFANDCQTRHGGLLPHMGTRSLVEDLEAIRVALGREKISYFGYSYGTYLGAAYATKYPQRVHRMVLDSVARPSHVWYQANLDQNVVFERRINAFFTWIARHHKTYRLGATRERVAKSYRQARTALFAEPAGGRMGGTELDDLFLANGYTNRTWPAHARALSAYVRGDDPARLRKLWSPPTEADQNTYTMYLAVECRDAPWPRDWQRWHHDHWRQYRSGYRFETWSNGWYNAPCAFWGAPGGPRPRVQGTAETPAMLLVHGTEDAATPYQGALETHRRFPTSRLVTQVGGGNHGVWFAGDSCVDPAVAAYLRDGTLPADRPGPDLHCPAGDPPEPRSGKAEKGAARLARTLPPPVVTDR